MLDKMKYARNRILIPHIIFLNSLIDIQLTHISQSHLSLPYSFVAVDLDHPAPPAEDLPTQAACVPPYTRAYR